MFPTIAQAMSTQKLKWYIIILLWLFFSWQLWLYLCIITFPYWFIASQNDITHTDRLNVRGRSQPNFTELFFFFCPWLEFTELLMCVNQEIYVNIVMYKYVCNIYYFLRSLELFMCSYCTSIQVSSFHMPCIISLHAVVGKVKLSFTNLQKP